MWQDMRNYLSSARGDNPYSQEITGILDTLHNDAQKAGIDGINYASLEWICNDLKNILQNKSRNNIEEK